MVFLLYLDSVIEKNADDFVEMFRMRTGYKIVEPAHMVLFIAPAFLCLTFS
jgi:hypothetical protein